MQIHSQIPFHSRLSFFWAGVDAALRRSPHSHTSSYRLTVALRFAGLTTLRVEVLPPHCTIQPATCPLQSLPLELTASEPLLFMPSSWLRFRQTEPLPAT